jgi:hypothetical protein
MRTTLLVLLAILAVTTPADALDPSLTPFTKAVSFYVNSDQVNLRRGPGIQFPVVTLLSQGTVVVPIQASDREDNPEGYEAFIWYKCALGNNQTTTGWIWGKYLSCKVQSSSAFWTLRAEQSGYDTTILFPLYGFANGGLSIKPPARTIVPVSTSFPVVVQSDAPSKTIGAVILTPRFDDGPIIDLKADAAIVESLKSVQYLVASDGRLIVGPFAHEPTACGDLPPELSNMQHQYVCSTLSEYERTQIAFSTLRVDYQHSCHLSVTAKGSPLRLDVFSYHLIAVSSKSTIDLACCLVRHPDGTVVRTNVHLSIEPGDWAQDEASQYYGHGEVVFDNAADFPDLPISMLSLRLSGFEGYHDHLYVTNGYVFFDLGEFWSKGG